MVTKKEDTENLVVTATMKEFLEEALKRGSQEQEFIESGVIGFDLALSNGKGVPVGNSALLWAKQGCGKTTLLLEVSKRLIARHKKEGKPFKVLYIDVEGSPVLIQMMGLKEYQDSGDFMVINGPLTWRKIEQLYTMALRGVGPLKDTKLIVIDSVNTILSDQNEGKSVADGDFGTKARERASFYAKFLPRCKEKGITSFFVAQARVNQDAGMFGDKKKAAVSFADLHNVDVILKCEKKTSTTDTKKVEINTGFGTVKDQKKYVMTLNSSATDCKNRFFRGFPSEVLIETGVCVDNSYTLRKLLEANNYVKGKGGWFTVDTELGEALGISNDKLRASDLAVHLKEHASELVNFLKSQGQYRIEVSEGVECTSTDNVEDTDEE